MNQARSMSHSQKLPASPHKQRKPASTRKRQVSRVAFRQETYLAQTYIHKTEATGNDAHEDALATWTEVKTLHKQQNSDIQSNAQTNLNLWNTTVWYGFYFKHRQILERFQSKVLHTTVDAPWYMPNTVITRYLQTPTIKEEILYYSPQYSARLSVHPNDPVVNLMAQHDDRRLWRHLPNNLPTRF
jgi:hypothetical protein